MKLYFLGICGTAMGNAALLFRDLGHEVLGADAGVYPPMSDVLQQAGVAVLEGWDANRLEQLAPDLVVVGNALSRGNPEIEWLLRSNRIRTVSLPQLLGEELLAHRPSIVVSGTHGKTTTTTMAASLLQKSGAQPGWLIGGVPLDLPGGAYLGSPKAPFVIEGDEYDSAFFDKRSKFIHYRPNILIINNLEFDHGDIFRDLADVQRSFNHVLRLVPDNGYVLANGDDANLAPLLDVPWTQVLRVGEGPRNDLRIRAYRETASGSRFQLSWRGTLWDEVNLPLPGRHNARNAAMAALAAALALKPDDPFCALDLGLLSSFRGVKRRLEVRAETPQLTVIEDFAHHPTAVTETLQTVRARYPRHQLIAAFEPRSNTAATNTFQAEFGTAFAQADNLYLGPVHRGERMDPAKRLDTATLANDHPDGHHFAANGALLAALQESLASASGKPAVVIFLSNGSFDGIIGHFAAWASNRVSEEHAAGA